MFDADKTRMIGLPYGEKLWQYVKPFSSNPGTSRTDGWTGRQTDRQNCYINIARQSRVGVLTRDKNWWIYVDMIANKFAKFHAKRLNRNENIPKSFRRATFFETPCMLKCFVIFYEHKLTGNIITNSQSQRRYQGKNMHDIQWYACSDIDC